MRSLTTLVCTMLVVVSSACTGHRPGPAPAALKSALPIPPSRAPAEFGNFVRTREPQLQFCYQDTRAASPSLAGSATVAVTVAPDGNVVTADIVSRSWSGKGEVLSLVPLRNRRDDKITRISEGMTRWRMADGRVGYGLSEYLDQIVDGRPVGLAE